MTKKRIIKGNACYSRECEIVKYSGPTQGSISSYRRVGFCSTPEKLQDWVEHKLDVPEVRDISLDDTFTISTLAN